MARTADEIISEMQMVIGKQKELSVTLASLSKELSDLNKNEWDWVTVRQASEITGMSQAYFYNRINKGNLKTKRMSAKVYINIKEINLINDVC